jgi:hypothetical protein
MIVEWRDVATAEEVQRVEHDEAHRQLDCWLDSVIMRIGIGSPHPVDVPPAVFAALVCYVQGLAEEQRAGMHAQLDAALLDAAALH